MTTKKSTKPDLADTKKLTADELAELVAQSQSNDSEAVEEVTEVTELTELEADDKDG
jgi:hypothetical protein